MLSLNGDVLIWLVSAGATTPRKKVSGVGEIPKPGGGMNTVFDRKHRFSPTKTVIERFNEKVNKTDTCWLWTAYLLNDGYASFRFPNGSRAHRFSYEYFKGPIPNDLTVDHICRVRHCVNPDHLRLLSNKENVLIGFGPPANNRRMTHCKRGHELAGINIQIYRGRRCCLICRKEQGRIYRDKR